jgi:predicted DNA-binding protein (UPF0278 family)
MKKYGMVTIRAGILDNPVDLDVLILFSSLQSFIVERSKVQLALINR